MILTYEEDVSFTVEDDIFDKLVHKILKLHVCKSFITLYKVFLLLK